jgi:RNA polymerase sigma factor (sigma-70 family)
MTTERLQGTLKGLRDALQSRAGSLLSDAALLERFLTLRDEDAFAILMRRHGPVVLGVCRRVLRHEQDAQDAFQATFLVLVRRASSIRRRESVGNWLYGVAHRTALEARSAAVRRRATEMQVVTLPEPVLEPGESHSDLRPILDEGLSGLPDKYREAMVLCDLEGQSRREAALLLGIPEGTLSSRLAAGRRLLAQYLARRGVTLSAGALASGQYLSQATAAVPAPLLQATGQAAALFAAGHAGGVVSANVVALTERVLKAMLLTRLKLTAVVLVVVAALGAGVGVARLLPAAQDSAPAAQGEACDIPKKDVDEPGATRQEPKPEDRPPDLLREAQLRREIADQQAQGTVEEAIRSSNRMAATSPEDALEMLQRTLEAVRNNADISETVRASLVGQLEKAVRKRSAALRKEREDSPVERQIRQAIVEELERQRETLLPEEMERRVSLEIVSLRLEAMQQAIKELKPEGMEADRWQERLRALEAQEQHLRTKNRDQQLFLQFLDRRLQELRKQAGQKGPAPE